MEQTAAAPSAESVEDWLSELRLTPARVSRLSGDVSSRHYYRVRLTAAASAGSSLIVAGYPPDLRAACSRFLESTRLLQGVGITVPTVRADDCARGLMLLEDLGPKTLFDERHREWEELEPSLSTARDVIDRLKRLPLSEVSALNPPLDSKLLRRELQLTWDVFLAPRGLVGAGSDEARLRRALDLLCERLGELAPVPTHRDLMARNLVPIDPSPQLAVLDHQDLRLAPPGYDLASLCNDSLYPPHEMVERLLRGEDEVAYRRCAVQRTLKAVGTFVSFAARVRERGGERGDAGAAEGASDCYLELVAPTLRSCLVHLSELPEGRQLVGDLHQFWLPVLGP